MEIHIHVHHHNAGEEKVLDLLNYLKSKIETMAKTQAELAAELNEVATQIQKVGTESTKTLQKVDELQATIDAQGGVTEELQAAVDAVKAQVKLVDDLVPDTTEPTTETTV